MGAKNHTSSQAEGHRPTLGSRYPDFPDDNGTSAFNHKRDYTSKLKNNKVSIAGSADNFCRFPTYPSIVTKHNIIDTPLYVQIKKQTRLQIAHFD